LLLTHLTAHGQHSSVVQSGIDKAQDEGWRNRELLRFPSGEFANLYWFRCDWFQRPDLRGKFKGKYGYDLGVPVNWSAYEDIAEFFTNDVKDIDGVNVYGHMDYGKKDRSLGWRFSDAWLSMAGNGDKGIPNDKPVDEWGVRMEGMTFSESGPVPAQGNIGQQMSWYTAFTADMVKPGLPVVMADGAPKWRMALSPKGAYSKDGMKLGGLVEFYRSPARMQWTPTGNNIPDCLKMAQLWWQNIGETSSAAKTPQQARDALAAAQDDVLTRLERANVQGECDPKMNAKTTAEDWFKKAEAISAASSM
jgi:ABC-type glycerol-3-phosphate transport system substrate-binding protein